MHRRTKSEDPRLGVNVLQTEERRCSGLTSAGASPAWPAGKRLPASLLCSPEQPASPPVLLGSLREADRSPVSSAASDEREREADAGGALAGASPPRGATGAGWWGGDAALLRSISLSTPLLLGLVACMLAVLVAVPVVFSSFVTGDALWGRFAHPGEYLAVSVSRVSPSLASRRGGVVVVVSLAGGGGEGGPPGVAWQFNAATGVCEPPFSQAFDQGPVDRATAVQLTVYAAQPRQQGGSSDGGDGEDPNNPPPLGAVLGAAILPAPSPGSQLQGWFNATPAAGDGGGGLGGAAAAAAASVAVYATVGYDTRRSQSAYCEAIRAHSPVAQPADSYSNVLFVLLGSHVAAVGLADWARRRRGAAPHLAEMQRYPVYSLVQGVCLVYAGASSFLFHASQTAVGQVLDVSGVYLLPSTPALYVCLRVGLFGRPDSRLAATLFAALSAAAAALFYEEKWQLEKPLGGSQNTVLILAGTLIGAAALWAWAAGSPRALGAATAAAASTPSALAAAVAAAAPAPHRHPLRRRPRALWAHLRAARPLPAGLRYRWAALSVASILAAFGARQMDVEDHVLCEPRGWFQLHALWHVLAALSLYSLWLFLRTELPAWPAGGDGGAGGGAGIYDDERAVEAAAADEAPAAVCLPPPRPAAAAGDSSSSGSGDEEEPLRQQRLRRAGSQGPHRFGGAAAAAAAAAAGGAVRGAELASVAAAGLRPGAAPGSGGGGGGGGHPPLPPQPMDEELLPSPSEGPVVVVRGGAHLRTRSRDAFVVVSVL